MELEKVREIVLNIIKDKEYSLYDISEEKIGNDNILQILIDKEPHISIDELAYLNEAISLELDKIDANWPPYLLEVSSPGAEKELRNYEEIANSIEKYVYFEVADANYFGYLLEVNPEYLVIKLNLKGRIKKQQIAINDILFIRLAVKV